MKSRARIRTREGKKGSKRTSVSNETYCVGGEGRTVTMLLKDFAHDLLGLFVGDLLGLLEEEVGLLLIRNVQLCGHSMADFGSKELKGGGALGMTRKRKEIVQTSGSLEGLPFSRDSLLEFFSLKDMIVIVTWGAPNGL